MLLTQMAQHWLNLAESLPSTVQRSQFHLFISSRCFLTSNKRLVTTSFIVSRAGLVQAGWPLSIGLFQPHRPSSPHATFRVTTWRWGQTSMVNLQLSKLNFKLGRHLFYFWKLDDISQRNLSSIISDNAPLPLLCKSFVQLTYFGKTKTLSRSLASFRLHPS